MGNITQPQNLSPEPGSCQTKQQDSPDAHCPSCGRFVGPYTSCPYCGAAISGRIPLKLVKTFALCLATLGLIVLWWLASRTEIPRLSVAEIEGMMNFAFVRIDGRITRSISYDPVSQYLGFWIDDGTGEIHVSAYRDTTQALLQAGVIPAPGDGASIAGSLRIREDYASMTLNNPEHLTLTHPAPAALKSTDISPLDEGRRVALHGEITSLSTPYTGLTLMTLNNPEHLTLTHPAPAALKSTDISPLDEGRRVALHGEITSLSSPYTGLTLMTLKDDAGEITITIDEIVQTLTGSLPEVNVGHWVMVTGTVTLYKGTPQVTLCDSNELSLRPIPPDPEPEVQQLSQITLTDLGSQVLVQGRVVAMEGIKGGLSATLDDGTAQIIVVLWQQVYSALDEPTNLDLGATITVYGEVSAYQGALEIIPRAASDITIQITAPEIPWLSIEALTRADSGRLVRVRGLLGSPEGFSSGVKIPLRDGSGRITVLLWSNIYQELKPHPAEDMLAEVTGIIDVYNGVLEIIPRSTYDVVNIDQGD